MKCCTAKSYAIFFGITTIAFCISTIVLAIQKADVERDLQDALDRLEAALATTTTASVPTSSVTPSPTIPTGTTESTTNSTASSTDPTNPTQPTTASTGSTVTPTPSTSTTSENPIFPTLPPNITDPETIIYRLPNDIRPIKYSIYYYPHLEASTFDGDVSVQIEVDNRTNLIAMHSKNFEIEGISILNMMTRMRVRIKKYYLDDARELLMIELEELLFKNTAYTVSVSYKGSLSGLTGMYASSYMNEKGEER